MSDQLVPTPLPISKFFTNLIKLRGRNGYNGIFELIFAFHSNTIKPYTVHIANERMHFKWNDKNFDLEVFQC